MFYKCQCCKEDFKDSVSDMFGCEICEHFICGNCVNGEKGILICKECATKFEYLEPIKELKAKLIKEFSVNREFTILQTKLEDLEIYLETYLHKLIRRGENK